MGDTERRQTTRNIEVLLGLPVEVAVELGAAEMGLGELLRLGPGSVIELSSKVGEPLRVKVNNKEIGTGEAVVIKRRFGIRMLSIINCADRLQQLS
jgi:flagellar motor switch protein FliN/FliY